MDAGDMPEAYRGLMQYLMRLRTYFADHYPDYTVSGSLYFGYMDMSYFSVSPAALKKRGLKAAIVFLHETCSFEIWLSGVNRKTQGEFYELFSLYEWHYGTICVPGKGVDAIVSAPLVSETDFDDLDALTSKIDHRTNAFLDAVLLFLNDIRP